MPKAASARIGSVLKRTVIAVLLVLLIACIYIFFLKPDAASADCRTNPNLARTTIAGNGRSVEAEVAVDSADKQQGLSDRNCLGNGKAMLFSYELPNDYCFWMKDMHFPIDMIWLDDDKKIVTVKDKISPDSYPDSFCPDKPAQYIVEVNAGAAKVLGWGVGTQLSF